MGNRSESSGHYYLLHKISQLVSRYYCNYHFHRSEENIWHRFQKFGPITPISRGGPVFELDQAREESRKTPSGHKEGGLNAIVLAPKRMKHNVILRSTLVLYTRLETRSTAEKETADSPAVQYYVGRFYVHAGQPCAPLRALGSSSSCSYVPTTTE